MNIFFFFQTPFICIFVLMGKETTEQHLQEHGIRPTAVRIVVWRELVSRSQVFSLGDVEQWIPTLDKSSIFRALRLFHEAQLIHEVDDGSGVTKYCLCRCEERGHLNHVHFSCTVCGKTLCLEDQLIPVVDLPDGFVFREVEYIVKGICPRCSRRR